MRGPGLKHRHAPGRPVFPDTYASMPLFATRINGRPALGELVTGNYFSLIGVPAVRGRTRPPRRSSAIACGLRPLQRTPTTHGRLLERSDKRAAGRRLVPKLAVA